MFRSLKWRRGLPLLEADHRPQQVKRKSPFLRELTAFFGCGGTV